MKKEYIDIYYDHYKDTFERISQEKAIRDKYFIYMLLLSILILLSVYLPNVIGTLVSGLLKEKTGSSKSIDYNWIKSIIIFAFIWVSFAYFRSCLNIERLYKYIHKVESELTKRMGSLEITRESTNYLYSYPIVLSFIYRIYNFLIPLSVIVLFIVLWSNDNIKPLSNGK